MFPDPYMLFTEEVEFLLAQVADIYIDPVDISAEPPSLWVVCVLFQVEESSKSLAQGHSLLNLG